MTFMSKPAGEAAVDLRALLNTELEAYRSAGTILLSGAPVMVPSKLAIPLAHAVHDLAAHAAKHGVLAARDGLLWIGWLRENGSFALRWEESRASGGRKRSEKGFETGLRRLVEGQLVGQLERIADATGLTLLIRVPLPPMAANADDHDDPEIGSGASDALACEGRLAAR